jgi:porin
LSQEAPDVSAGPLHWLGQDRAALDEYGVAIEASLVVDWLGPFSGGTRKPKRDTVRSLFDVNVAFDLEPILGLSGGTLFLDAYGFWGRNGTGDTGEFQGYSNIDVDEERFQLAEVWYEQYLFGERLRVKLGKVEANSEFAFVDAAGDFINSSAGPSPTLFVLPTYPEPAMSINVFAYPTDFFYLGAAVYDGAVNDGVSTGNRGPKTFFSDSKSDDYFAIGEVGFLWEGGRIAAGPWYHTADFDRWDGGRDSGTLGMFALAEAQVWRENPQADGDEQGVSVFGRYGYADKDLMDVEAVHHVGVGVLWNGAIPGRDDDAIGLRASWVDLSNKAGFGSNETALEFFYLCQLTPFLGVKGDLQYFANPAGDSSATDVVVGGLRIEMSF